MKDLIEISHNGRRTDCNISGNLQNLSLMAIEAANQHPVLLAIFCVAVATALHGTQAGESVVRLGQRAYENQLKKIDQ